MALFGTPSEHFDAEQREVLAVDHQKLRLWARCHLQRWGNAGPAMVPVVDLGDTEIGVTDKGKAVLNSIAAGSTSVLGAVAASLPFGASSVPIATGDAADEPPGAPSFAPPPPAAPFPESCNSGTSLSGVIFSKPSPTEVKQTKQSMVATEEGWTEEKGECTVTRQAASDFGNFTADLIEKVKCVLDSSTEDDLVFPAYGDEQGNAETSLGQPQPISAPIT